LALSILVRRATFSGASRSYAVECSILKVYGSEMLSLVADELVATMGGYGYVEEYPAERYYRDARINRIFEGTNEINLMIITGWLMKRALNGRCRCAGDQKVDGRGNAAPSFEAGRENAKCCRMRPKRLPRQRRLRCSPPVWPASAL